MRALILATFLLFTFQASAEEFFIDEYEFQWLVHKEGEAELSVIKTDESTYIRLYNRAGGYSSLRLTGNEAVDISKALLSTRDYFTKQKGTAEDISESVSAGDYKVIYRTSVKYGFSVNIIKSSGYSMDRLSLEKSEAIKFQKFLAKAPNMIEFINTKVKF